MGRRSGRGRTAWRGGNQKGAGATAITKGTVDEDRGWCLAYDDTDYINMHNQHIDITSFRALAIAQIISGLRSDRYRSHRRGRGWADPCAR